MNINHALKYFDAQTLQEGQERHSQGRVISCSYDDAGNSLTGKVHGSQAKPYAVSVFLVQPGFDVSWSLCTCERRKACKHAAALVYAFFDFDDERTFSSISQKRDKQARIDSPLPTLDLPAKQSVLASLAENRSPESYDLEPESDLRSAEVPATVQFKRHTNLFASSLQKNDKEAVKAAAPAFRPGVIDVSDESDQSDRQASWQFEIHESGDFWFGLSLGIDVDGETISIFPVLQRALSKLKSFTARDIASLGRDGKFYSRLPDGRILILPFERVRAILANLVELCVNNAPESDQMRVSLSQLNAVAQDPALKGFKVNGAADFLARADQIMQLANLPAVQPAKNFQAQLRPYQLDGLAWLQGLARAGLSGILADDMGLGKTVQVLAHLNLEKEQQRLSKPVLVVCPTSVLNNWLTETKRFAPDLTAFAYHGAERSSANLGNMLKAAALKPDIVLTTYAILIRDSKQLADVEWQAVILDEAQAIKNAGTKGAKVARSLKSQYRLCVSGTPVENHLGELWSLFEFLMPGMLDDVKVFNKHFRTPIEKQKNVAVRQLLARRLSPFILRRLKEQVAKDLPDKTLMLQELELTSMQRDLYETVRSAGEQRVKEEISKKGINRSQIVILDAMLKLRQVCCDPRLVKLELPQPATILDSAKLEAVIDLLEPLVENGRKILLFSQFTSMLDLIAPELKAREIAFVQLRGDTTDRVTPVAEFQDGSASVFLISLKAGGTGLNLTAADTVIHYDPWWNPAVEDQATDRAHRIGQTKKVFIYKFVARGTIEERMLELQTRKRALCEAIFDAESAASISFSESDLQFLFEPLT